MSYTCNLLYGQSHISTIFSLKMLLPPRSTLFPYTTLFRSVRQVRRRVVPAVLPSDRPRIDSAGTLFSDAAGRLFRGDRKSTRLNSSHPSISYAVFCLKKKKH